MCVCVCVCVTLFGLIVFFFYFCIGAFVCYQIPNNPCGRKLVVLFKLELQEFGRSFVSRGHNFEFEHQGKVRVRTYLLRCCSQVCYPVLRWDSTRKKKKTEKARERERVPVYFSLPRDIFLLKNISICQPNKRKRKKNFRKDFWILVSEIDTRLTSLYRPNDAYRG